MYLAVLNKGIIPHKGFIFYTENRPHVTISCPHYLWNELRTTQHWAPDIGQTLQVTERHLALVWQHWTCLQTDERFKPNNGPYHDDFDLDASHDQESLNASSDT